METVCHTLGRPPHVPVPTQRASSRVESSSLGQLGYLVATVAEEARVRIELCGTLLVELDGRRVEGQLRGRQGRRLFAYLALNRHAPVSRDRLMEAVWAEALPRDPAAVLNTLLSRLRRTLGEGRLEGRSQLRLNLGPTAEVDVEAAVAARNRALDALARSAFGEALAAARRAIAITESELMPDEDADWLSIAREDLSAVRADALEAAARAGLGLGGAELAGARHAAERVIELLPYRETGYALLMDVHAARGNVAEALRVFDDLRVLLREELGTTPAAPLVALHERLLTQGFPEEAAHAPADADAGVDTDEPPQLPLPTPLASSADFVGRTAALERLRELLKEVGSGERRFAFVDGEPGIGKTSLAARFAQEAHAGGAIVLYGRSDEQMLLSYQPWIEALCHYIGRSPVHELEPATNPELDELGQLMPDLGRPLSGREDKLLLEPDTQRFRMFQALVAVLARLARARPLVVVLDDLHWADGASLMLLRHVARAVDPTRLMVLGSYRDVEVDSGHPLARLLADLRREVPIERVPLGGLDEEETRALVATRLGCDDPELADRLRRATAGNPFFLEETLHALATSEAPVESATDRVEDALPGVGIPEGAKDMIARRLGALGRDASEVLSLAAVLGPTFALPALEELAGAPGTEVLAVVERAVAGRLVTELHEGPERFGFTHALVRKALYEGLSASRRMRWHRRAGEVLEARRSELEVRAAELARHFIAGGDAGRALRYSREAAEHALESLAYEEAAEFYGRALAVIEDAPDGADAERCDLLLALGDARLRAGQPQARESYAQAAALARGRWPERLALAALGFGGRYYEAGVADTEFIALLEEALRALPHQDDPLRVRVEARLAEALHFAGTTDRPLELSRHAVQMARRLEDEDALAGALAGRHVALLHIGHLAERLDVSAELTELAYGGGRLELAVHAHEDRIFDLLELGDVAAARRAHDELRRLAAELRQPLFRHFALAWTSVWAQMDGRFDEAERLAGELLELQQSLGAKDAEIVFAARLFALRRDQGRLGELLPAVEGFIEQFPALAPWRTVLPMIRAAAGDAERARAELLALGPRLPELPQDFFWLTAMTGVAEGCAALGEGELSADVYRLLEPYAERTVQIGFAACLGPVERLLGLLAATGGELGRACAHFERAFARSASLGGRALVVRTQAEYGELLYRSDRNDARERGAELVAAALSGGRELGMAGVVERLEGVSAAASV